MPAACAAALTLRVLERVSRKRSWRWAVQPSRRMPRLALAGRCDSHALIRQYGSQIECCRTGLCNVDRTNRRNCVPVEMKIWARCVTSGMIELTRLIEIADWSSARRCRGAKAAGFTNTLDYPKMLATARDTVLPRTA